MGLFSNLLDTYEKCNAAVNIIQSDNNGDENEAKTFLPIFHTTFKSKICVMLDSSGNLISIERDKNDQTIIIPCTEKSASRSGKAIAPHPLCDQLSYLDRELVPEKFQAYITLLDQWKDENAKLNAIYVYLLNNSIVADMETASLFKDSEMDESHIDKTSKIGIRFSIIIPEDNYPNVWQDINIRDKWIRNQNTSFQEYDSFDYLSGGNLTSIVSTHPKNINSRTANAKLVSCNDNTYFTYRGRFAQQNEAILIDSLSTQKVHQTLKWLINNYGYHIDSQVIVIWAVDEKTEETIKPNENSLDTFCELQNKRTNMEILNQVYTEIDANYAHKLVNSLKGYGNDIKQHNKKVIIVIFDAATSGRMGVVFYQELPENEYLHNIANWHEESTWHLIKYIKEKNEDGKEFNKSISFIGCPSFNDILIAAYGKPRSINDSEYKKLEKKVQKQMLECMFGNFALPKSIVYASAARASHPMSFTNNKGKFIESSWKQSLNVSCALIKKNIKQQNKEDILMELEEQRNDRDYLYGRLLAVADKLEKVAMYKADKKDQRATNAIRLMSSFSCKPFSTWGVLWNKLIPFVNQLKGAGYYQLIINSIMSLFKEGEYEDNKPLSPLYLLGYSAQMRLINKEKKEDINDVDITEQD